MPVFSDAQNLLDLLDHVWIGIVAIAVVAVPNLIANWKTNKRIKDIAGKTAAIEGQVVNGHKDKPALRTDLDVVVEAVPGLLKGIASLNAAMVVVQRKQEELHEGQIVERAAREEGVSRLNSRLDALLSDRRSGVDRRQNDLGHDPERRSGSDRRSGTDRRKQHG